MELLGEQLAGKRVVVTGASGFLGAHLCRRLHALGAQVIGVSRTPRREPEFVEWKADDLSDVARATRLLESAKPDVVYHLAGFAHAATSLDMVEPTFESILATTKNVLVAAAQAGRPRVVLPGSLEEPEDDRAAPASPYAAARFAAAAYGRMFNALYGVEVVNLRIFMTYGPGQKRTKIVPYVITSMLKGEPPQLSSGRRPVDWIYVDDLVDGMAMVAAASGVAGTTIDLGSGTLVTIRELVEEIERIVRPPTEPIFGARPERLGETTRAADLDATQRLIPWQPRTPLVDGLRRTVEWYRDQLAAESGKEGVS